MTKIRFKKLRMIVDYKSLVLHLLKRKKYPILLDYIIIDIYHKIIESKSVGKRYLFSTHCPEVVFNSENRADEIVYLCSEGQYFYVHKENPNDLHLRSLPLKCIKVKIVKDYINKILKTNYQTFEEEIYNFITFLNFDISKIREILNLSFVESTRFIPDHIKTWVSDYKTENISAVAEPSHYFGQNFECFDSRIYAGKLSPCASNDIIVSCRNAQGVKDDHLEHLMPQNCNLYNVHYITEYKSYIPLAYNPLENPIISEIS